jgi:poly-gamma-glutamate capsule biosynthesis protein CapA/YwtB (metallophosphatase superfamily)
MTRTRLGLALALGLAAVPLRALTVSAVGDILLWYGAMPGSVLDTPPPPEGPWTVETYPFALVKPRFKGLVFGNLEGPLTQAPIHRFKPAWMKHYFKSPAPDSVAALNVAGFRMVSLANNHSMDCGAQGLSDTLAALAAGPIASVGGGMDDAAAGRPVVADDGQGQQAVFLAYDFVGPPGTFAGPNRAGAARAERARLLASVRRLARRRLPVLVSLHWGVEQRSDYPVAEPLPWQKKLARSIIDAGATVVLGGHSHAVSRFEERGRGLIAYSLGNFAFSGGRMGARRRSVILRFELKGKALKRRDLVPVYTDSPGHPFQPLPMPRPQAKLYLARLLGRRSYHHYNPWPAQAGGPVQDHGTPLSRPER